MSSGIASRFVVILCNCYRRTKQTRLEKWTTLPSPDTDVEEKQQGLARASRTGRIAVSSMASGFPCVRRLYLETDQTPRSNPRQGWTPGAQQIINTMLRRWVHRTKDYGIATHLSNQSINRSSQSAAKKEGNRWNPSLRPLFLPGHRMAKLVAG